MWGRKDDQSNGAETPSSASLAGARPSEAPPKPAPPAPATPRAGTSRLGQSINFKGEIHSDEDLLVDGSVDGSISVPKYSLVIGAEGKVRATIEANAVMIRGQVEGKINASEKVEISKTGRFKGDLITRRLEIHDGAVFVGSSSVHQAKAASPAPAPPAGKKAEAESKPPAPAAKPAPPAPTPEKRAEAETRLPASQATPSPLKPAPAVKPARPNPVPAQAIPQRPLTKP